VLSRESESGQQSGEANGKQVDQENARLHAHYS